MSANGGASHSRHSLNPRACKRACNRAPHRPIALTHSVLQRVEKRRGKWRPSRLMQGNVIVGLHSCHQTESVIRPRRNWLQVRFWEGVRCQMCNQDRVNEKLRMKEISHGHWLGGANCSEHHECPVWCLVFALQPQTQKVQLHRNGCDRRSGRDSGCR